MNRHDYGAPGEAQPQAGSLGRRRGKEVQCSFRREAETERNGFRPDAAAVKIHLREAYRLAAPKKEEHQDG